MDEIENIFEKPAPAKFIASKWEQVDPEELEKQGLFSF